MSLKNSDAVFEAVEPGVGFAAVGFDVFVDVLESGGDVLDGEGEAYDGVSAFGGAAGLGAEPHGADRNRGSDDGCCNLDHRPRGITYAIVITALAVAI